jgi:hypothetical protein
MLEGLFHPSAAADSASCVHTPIFSNAATALAASSSLSPLLVGAMPVLGALSPTLQNLLRRAPPRSQGVAASCQPSRSAAPSVQQPNTAAALLTAKRADYPKGVRAREVPAAPKTKGDQAA